jgi:hypothetical protein
MGLLDPFRTMFKARTGGIWLVRADAMMEYSSRGWAAIVRPPMKVEKDYFALDVRKVDGHPHPTLHEIDDKSLLMMVPPKSRVGQEFPLLAHERPPTVLSEVYCGLEDASGDIWLGADRAILRLDHVKREWQTYLLPENLIRAAVIYEGRDARLWFADSMGMPQSMTNRETDGRVIGSRIGTRPMTMSLA